jgi:hypothetical protein
MGSKIIMVLSLRILSGIMVGKTIRMAFKVRNIQAGDSEKSRVIGPQRTPLTKSIHELRPTESQQMNACALIVLFGQNF